MKAVKFLLLGSFFLVAGAANGQTFFKDSTVWYVHKQYPSVGSGWFSFFHKEIISLDSVSNQIEYYSVVRTPFIYDSWSPDTLAYQLWYHDSVLYFNGDVQVQYDSFIFFENVLLYNLKWTTDDTVRINLLPGWSRCEFFMDSIIYDTLWERKKFYYSQNISTGYCHQNYFYSPFFYSQIGFNSGLLPFDLDHFWVGGIQNLVSVCSNGRIIYADSNYTNYNGGNFYDICDEDTLKALFQKIFASIKEPQKIKATIYPNPSTDKLHIKLTEPKGNYQVQIFSTTGKKFTNLSIGPGEEVLDISALPKGIFIVLVTDEKGSFFSQKVIKQ